MLNHHPIANKSRTRPSTSKGNQISLLAQFQQTSKIHLQKQPRSQLCSFIHQEAGLFILRVTVNVLSEEDIPFLSVLMTLQFSKLVFVLSGEETPSTKVSLKERQFFQTPHFRELFQMVCRWIEQPDSPVRSLTFDGIPLSVHSFKLLCKPLEVSRHLKELVVARCGLTDAHLESIKSALALNESLVSVSFCGNHLKQVGGMIGKILSEHCRRRNQIIWAFNLRGESPGEDLAGRGICEFDLEGNQIDDDSVKQLMAFLKDDCWTKCLNLKKNQLGARSIKEFAILMKTNFSLISLDLRENQGLTKEYSRYLYKKLVLNMEKYRQIKRIQPGEGQPTLSAQYVSVQPQLSASHQTSPPQNKHNLKKKTVFKEDHNLGSFESEHSMEHQNKSHEIAKESDIQFSSNKMQQQDGCLQCQSKQSQIQKLEQENAELKVKMKRFKQTISTAVQHSFTEERRSKLDLDDDVAQRIEQILLEMTKLVEDFDDHSCTQQQNQTNPLENHSLSNTIPLYSQRSHLLELSRQINENEILLKEALEGEENAVEDVLID